MIKKCKICGKEFNAKYNHLCCSEMCSKENERLLVNKAHMKYFNEVSGKLKDIKLRSGCMVCGYNKTSRALSFHHLKDKKIRLSGSRGSKKDIFEEVKKCIILCCNCHMELHEGLIDLDNITGKRV